MGAEIFYSRRELDSIVIMLIDMDASKVTLDGWKHVINEAESVYRPLQIEEVYGYGSSAKVATKALA